MTVPPARCRDRGHQDAGPGRPGGFLLISCPPDEPIRAVRGARHGGQRKLQRCAAAWRLSQLGPGGDRWRPGSLRPTCSLG